MDVAALTALARRIVGVSGVVAVTLGGSRARGTHRPDSDFDVGIYYRRGLDVAGLRALAAREADGPVELTEPGGWGPWVDGGGWLTIRGANVDWIYRDLDRVHRVWAHCRGGRYETGIQAGHPLGFYSHAYAGEVALCQVLADPSGELTDLRERTRRYPVALGDALVEGLWEADFAVSLAAYGASNRGFDPVYAAGCLFRAVGVACHALHGHAREWLISEKGMVAVSGRLGNAPPDFAERAQVLLADVGDTPARVRHTLAEATALLADVRTATARAA